MFFFSGCIFCFLWVFQHTYVCSTLASTPEMPTGPSLVLVYMDMIGLIKMTLHFVAFSVLQVSQHWTCCIDFALFSDTDVNIPLRVSDQRYFSTVSSKCRWNLFPSGVNNVNTEWCQVLMLRNILTLSVLLECRHLTFSRLTWIQNKRDKMVNRSVNTCAHGT